MEPSVRLSDRAHVDGELSKELAASDSRSQMSSKHVSSYLVSFSNCEGKATSHWPKGDYVETTHSCSPYGTNALRIVPENDPIQKALCGLMDHRVAQQQLVDNEDDSAEVAKRNRLLLDAEKTRKQTALEKKRGQVCSTYKAVLTAIVANLCCWLLVVVDVDVTVFVRTEPSSAAGVSLRCSPGQVAYGSKEWKTEQRTLRQKEAEAAFLLAGGEANTAHAIVTPHVGDVKADERGDVGGGLARGAAAAIGGKLSKLNLSFRASAKKLF